MMKSMFNLLLLNLPIIINFYILIIITMPNELNKLHPIILMIMLIMITFMISLKMNLIFKSWFNFFLILVIIGGLMVIFLYIISLTNNNLMMIINLMNFMLKSSNWIFIMLMSFTLMYFLQYNYNQSTDLWNYYKNFNNWNENLLSELYNYMKNSMIFIMMYLYFSMICIMNICYKSNNPLRQIYFYE